MRVSLGATAPMVHLHASEPPCQRHEGPLTCAQPATPWVRRPPPKVRERASPHPKVTSSTPASANTAARALRRLGNHDPQGQQDDRQQADATRSDGYLLGDRMERAPANRRVLIAVFRNVAITLRKESARIRLPKSLGRRGSGPSRCCPTGWPR